MNLGWSQAEWTEFFEKFGSLMSMYKALEDYDLIMNSNKNWIWVRDDLLNRFSDWQLDGLELGKNTDEDGKIYVTVSALYGNVTLQLFKDSARGYADLVAEGNAAGVGSLTLTEENSSGLTGTVNISNITANSVIYLDVVQGYLAQIINLDEVDIYDAQVKTDLLAIASKIKDGYIRIEQLIESLAKNILTGFVPDKLETTEDSSVMYSESQAADGTVTVEFTGIGKKLIDDMEDQGAPAGAQDVAKSSPWATTDEPDLDNTGTAILVWTPYDHARAGLFALECISNTLGSENFEVSERDDDGVSLSGSLFLIPDSDYKSVELGISTMRLTRAVTEVSDPGGHFTSYGVLGISPYNSTAGNIYFRYNKTTDVLYAYSDSARTLLVAQATGVTAGAPDAVMTEQNGSGLTAYVTFNGVDPGTVPYDFQACASSFAEGDKFYSRLSEDTGFSRGKINTFFGRLFGLILPSSALNTIPDGMADRGFGRRN